MRPQRAASESSSPRPLSRGSLCGNYIGRTTPFSTSVFWEHLPEGLDDPSVRSFNGVEVPCAFHSIPPTAGKPAVLAIGAYPQVNEAVLGVVNETDRFRHEVILARQQRCAPRRRSGHSGGGPPLSYWE